MLKSVKIISYQSCRKRTQKYFASFSHVIHCIKLILTKNPFFFHQLSKTALILSNKEHIPHLTYLFLVFYHMEYYICQVPPFNMVTMIYISAVSEIIVFPLQPACILRPLVSGTLDSYLNSCQVVGLK